MPFSFPLSHGRWERFLSLVEKQRTAEAVAAAFPFKEYFSDAPQALFTGASYEAVRGMRGDGWGSIPSCANAESASFRPKLFPRQACPPRE